MLRKFFPKKETVIQNYLKTGFYFSRQYLRLEAKLFADLPIPDEEFVSLEELVRDFQKAEYVYAVKKKLQPIDFVYLLRTQPYATSFTVQHLIGKKAKGAPTSLLEEYQENISRYSKRKQTISL